MEIILKLIKLHVNLDYLTNQSVHLIMLIILLKFLPLQGHDVHVCLHDWAVYPNSNQPRLLLQLRTVQWKKFLADHNIPLLLLLYVFESVSDVDSWWVANWRLTLKVSCCSYETNCITRFTAAASQITNMPSVWQSDCDVLQKATCSIEMCVWPQICPERLQVWSELIWWCLGKRRSRLKSSLCFRWLKRPFWWRNQWSLCLTIFGTFLKETLLSQARLFILHRTFPITFHVYIKVQHNECLQGETAWLSVRARSYPHL